MININLLSPSQKKELKLKRIYIAIKELVMLFLLFAILTGILLLTSRYVLEQELTSLILKNSINIKATQEINEEIIVANEKINNAYDIQSKFKKWSQFFVDLSKLKTEKVSISLLKIYGENNILEMQGKAQTRQDLIKLQKTLEESTMFTEVNLPLNDLISKENNSFNIQAQINPDYEI